jgi:hypothetical protein
MRNSEGGTVGNAYEFVVENVEEERYEPRDIVG